jgi:hypothetical protein
MEGCHFDGTPYHNNIANLRWDTRSGNQRDAVRHGTQRNFKGTAHHKAKLTDDDVRLMRKMYAGGGWTSSALGRRFGVSQATAYGIVKGTGWKHIS